MENEVETIQQAKSGHLEAYNSLVLAYQDTIYKQALSILGDVAAAEDITQEAFLIAFRKLGTFRNGSFRSWLLKITTHLCLDELRRKARHPSFSFEPQDPNGDEIETAYWMVDMSESPEEAVIRHEFQRVVQECLSRLSPNFRTVITLVDLQEMDYAQAAEILDVPVGTVKSRVARARQQLKRLLQAGREKPRAHQSTRPLAGFHFSTGAV